MNTPSHIAASLLLWKHEKQWQSISAVVTGAILPDAPMFGFYAYQRFMGTSERVIWSTSYFEPSWQLFFDLFNSLPLAFLLIALFWWLDVRMGVLVCGSAMLHMCCDLPVHHDDAHRHFLPLSTWRFQSPISYWDPQHYGPYFATFELVFSIVGCAYVGRQAATWPMRLAAFGTLGMYAFGILFAILVWIR